VTAGIFPDTGLTEAGYNKAGPSLVRREQHTAFS